MRKLRESQERLVSEIREAARQGHKHIMAMAPTGFGKTLTSAHIVKSARDKGSRVVFTVPAISLVNQTYDAFTKEGLNPHGKEIGVIQAQHELTDTSKPIQIASLDTIASWKARTLANKDRTDDLLNNSILYPPANIVIIDEAHNNKKVVYEWMHDHPEILFIGLTATPYTKGLGKHYTKLIKVETTETLIDKGFLCPMTVYMPTKPDLSGVKVRNTEFGKDYAIGQLSEVMSGEAIVADIVSTWLELGENRQTLCFCVDRQHAKTVAYEFRKNGIDAAYQDCFTKPDERKEIKEGFENGKYKIVCNVGTLTTGVDWDVRCIIFARPTKSEILFQQIAGRGLRTAEGKEDCIFLDHTNTTADLGFATEIDENFKALCDGRPKESSERKQQDKKDRKEQYECPACSLLTPVWYPKCPNVDCAHEWKPKSDVVVLDGKLERVKGKVTKLVDSYTKEEKQRWYSGILHIARMRNRSRGWAAHTYKDKFGVWPKGLSEKEIYPDIEVSNFIKAKAIRYAKAMEKKREQERQSYTMPIEAQLRAIQEFRESR